MTGLMSEQQTAPNTASREARTEAPSAVEMTEVSAGYRRKNVLDSVNASFAPGLIHGIIGPNGAGKSTLVKAALGLVPSSGDIRIAGERLASLSSKERARLMSYLPQDTPPVDFTGEQYVQMSRYARLGRFSSPTAEDEEAVDEALRMTGAGAWRDRPMRGTSGGERQLTALARAIAQNPQILIVDEPSSALDMGHEIDVFRLFKPWIGESSSRTIMAVLHDLDIAARFCDRLTLVDGGRVKASGPPAEILVPDLLNDAYGVTVDVRRSEATGYLTVTAV